MQNNCMEDKWDYSENHGVLEKDAWFEELNEEAIKHE